VLEITESARQAIEALIRNNDMSEQAGLRIDAEEPPAPSLPGAPLQLALAPQPAEGDQVVSENGARVFVAPMVAPALEDMVLDATASGGRVEFVLRPKEGEPV
jgi:iron-sulfur cluster assembly protein